MNRKLRIAVADDEPVMCEYLEKTLPVLGHEVVGVARSGRELVDLCEHTQPDLIITDIKMPGLDGLEASMEIGRKKPTPIIVISAYHDPELLERAGQAAMNHVQAYLVKPIKQADLEATIRLAMQRYEQFRMLWKEAADLRQALEDRKTIERAKGILMEKTGLTEQAAFQRLQKLASVKNLKLAQLAGMIVMAQEAMSLSEKEITSVPHR
jgi:AmiR/NasT family two-component response regulator